LGCVGVGQGLQVVGDGAGGGEVGLALVAGAMGKGAVTPRQS
jgi:hypothetical protein